MRPAFSYIRFSSGEQRHGTSQARQVGESKIYAERKGWKLDESLCIADLGRSGFHGEQRALKAFVAACSAGKVPAGSVLIVEKLDRMSREGIDPAYQLIREILLAGIDIAVSTEDRLFTKASLNEPMAIMEVLWKFYLAYSESKNKSDRAKSNWRIARETGKAINGKIPSWIIKNPPGSPKPFDYDEDKAETIRRIFELSAQGLGARRLIAKLYEEGRTNIAEGHNSRAGKAWNMVFIRDLLKNRQVLGENQLNQMDGKNRVPVGDPIPDYYPRIVTDELFYAARASTASRVRQRGPAGKDVANLFQGIIFDAKTGSSMKMMSVSNNDRAKGLVRRLCSYAADVQNTTPWESWRGDQFEALFMEMLRVEPDKLSGSIRIDPLPGLLTKLADVEAKIADLGNDLAGGVKLTPTIKLLLTRLDDERENVLAEIETAKAANVTRKGGKLDEARSIADALKNCPKDELSEMRDRLKAAIRLVVAEIWVLIERIDGNRLRKRITVWSRYHDGTEHVQIQDSYRGKLGKYQIMSLYPAAKRPTNLINWRFNLKEWRHSKRAKTTTA